MNQGVFISPSSVPSPLLNYVIVDYCPSNAPIMEEEKEYVI